MVYRQTEQTQSKKAGTRARILKEARLLVADGGFAAASVAQVAKKSGIAIGTMMSAPRPVDVSTGISANIVVAVVMRQGLIRRDPAKCVAPL